MPQEALYIGLMSGTSLDGIDAALVRLSHEDNSVSECQLVASDFLPMPPALKQFLHLLSSGQPLAISLLGQIQVELAEQSAVLVNRLVNQAGLDARDITAIGCHGVTVGHYPDQPQPFSLQLTDGSVLAARTGIDVISDFRMADIAEAGQGAPLVPPFHQALLQPKLAKLVVLNLGGIANISVMAEGKEVLGYDTGPANTLLNMWCERHKKLPYDKQGAWAASGTLNKALLALMLEEDYFNRSAPKSCGKELFNLHWLQSKLDGLVPATVSPQDVQCTLAHLTAKSVAQQVSQYDNIDTLLVCGGGVNNAFLMALLQQYLPDHKIASTMAHGVCPDNMEAMAFAWLAWCRIHNVAGNLPSVTGARRPKVLGAWYKC